MVAAVRLLWVPLLLAPAGVVFVATETTLGPIASAERIDIAPNFPGTLTLPTPAVGITTPERHAAVRSRAPRPVQHRHAAKVVKTVKVKRLTRVAHAPRPVYVVPKTIVARLVPTLVVVRPTASHTPKPKLVPKPKPAPTPVPPPAPAPPPTTIPAPTPTPPAEPPVQPLPTPAAPPSPVPTTPAPTPAPNDGDDDGQGQADDNTRPGNGWGDPNHEHTGPPGHKH